jgi:hypothetical protein
VRLSPARPERIAATLVVLANVAIIWSVPVLVGHDLAQHLSYLRIFADYGDPSLPLRDFFLLPERAQSYSTVYWLLVPVARATSVMTACRLVYSVYAITLPCALASLAAAAGHPRDSRMWAYVAGAALVWNPVSCMGFLPFTMAIPLFLAAAADALRWRRTASVAAATRLALGCAALVSLHFVAAAFLLLFVLVELCVHPSLRSAATLCVTVASCVLAAAAWQVAGDGHVAPLPRDVLVAMVAREGLLNGVVDTFGLVWSTPEAKWSFAVSSVLGPLPCWGKAIVAAAATVASWIVWRARGRCGWAARRSDPGLARSGLGLFAVTLLVPGSVCVPDAMSFIDFRLIFLLVPLGLAAMPQRWFQPSRARAAVVGLGAAVTALWAHQLGGFAAEGQEVLALLDHLDARAVLLALPFHDRSEYFDEDNSLTHYLPVYHTARGGGVTSLFWARVSHHLPVGYRPGKEPAHPSDWRPWEFRRGDLFSATHVIVEWPDAGDAAVEVAGAARLRHALGDDFALLGCRGRWCLYQTPSEQAAR